MLIVAITVSSRTFFIKDSCRYSPFPWPPTTFVSLLIIATFSLSLSDGWSQSRSITSPPRAISPLNSHHLQPMSAKTNFSTPSFLRRFITGIVFMMSPPPPHPARRATFDFLPKSIIDGRGLVQLFMFFLLVFHCI